MALLSYPPHQLLLQDKTAISGLTPSTTYQVSVVAIGDGTSFISSPESAKASVTTLPLTTSTTVTPTL